MASPENLFWLFFAGSINALVASSGFNDVIFTKSNNLSAYDFVSEEILNIVGSPAPISIIGRFNWFTR